MGALRAYNWVHIGVDLFSQGLLVMPFVGTLAVMHGLFVAAIAFLYLLSVIGALLEKDWARSTGITAVVLNLVLVVAAVIHGGPILQALAWSIIPVILLFYLFSSPESRAVTNT
ncbi:MAG: hypothetical protein ACREQV_25440 [Candidatus Binatia bacterium]